MTKMTRNHALTTLALFVLGWDLLVRWQRYPSFILPGPGVVWDRFVALLANGTLVMHTGVTLAEVLGGLALLRRRRKAR